MRKPLRTLKNPRFAKIVKRKMHIRKKVNGTAESPRICTVKSNKNLFVQAVDDVERKTLFSVSTFGKNAVKGGANQKGAKEIGAAVAARLKEKNIKQAVFDRNGRQYTGVIAVVADSIRENGIQI